MTWRINRLRKGIISGLSQIETPHQHQNRYHMRPKRIHLYRLQFSLYSFWHLGCVHWSIVSLVPTVARKTVFVLLPGLSIDDEKSPQV
jgi:hypothetical protein